MRKHKHVLNVTIMFLLITMIINIMAPFIVNAQQSEKKTVRVGWHEPPFFIRDENGRQSGYSYDYQIKLSAYTGWNYEYVEGTFSELLQMLKDGELDLLSDISYSEERTKYMLYSSIPMGIEAYYLFTSRDNTEISSKDLSTLNGKRIGVTKGSIQKNYFLDWAKNFGIEAELIECNTSEEESLKLLGKELDAFVTLDVYGSADSIVPVCKIGSSDFFFAVNKNRPDILMELDAALNRIQDENKYFDQQLYDKYLKNTETDRYLNSSEKDWVAKHGTIKVGYQDNYLAFCAQDSSTGELTGALKDYLDYAEKAFVNSKLKFEAVCFSNTSMAIDALNKGEIDCIFPANFSCYDAEKLGLVMSPTLMHTEMDAIVRANEKKEFLQKKSIDVAVNKGNTNYELFIEEHYPEWGIQYFSDTAEGLEAVANNKADCVIISNYRYNNISKQCEKLHLATVYTGVEMEYYFAVLKGNKDLYSILSRITNIVPDSAVNAALTYYSTEDVKTSFIDLLWDNLLIVIASVVIILLIIIILILMSIRAERKVIREKQLVKDLNKRVYVDALTSVRNKGAFNDYIGKLQERVDSEEQFDFAIGIFDCNDLKMVNDNFGHDKGDIYLKKACELICKIFDHSPVFRIGGDEFAVILQNSDFINKEELTEQFEKRRKEICESAENKWEEIHIALGIAVYDPQNDGSVSDTARRADRIMYENKSIAKALKNKKEN